MVEEESLVWAYFVVVGGWRMVLWMRGRVEIKEALAHFRGIRFRRENINA